MTETSLIIHPQSEEDSNDCFKASIAKGYSSFSAATIGQWYMGKAQIDTWNKDEQCFIFNLNQVGIENE